MRKSISLFLLGAVVCLFCACGNKTKEENPLADSLQTELNSKMAEMDETDLFLDAVNASMDSIVTMDGNIVKTNTESNRSVKEQIKANLEAYKMILETQRQRLAVLEQKLQNGDAKSQKMLKVIESLKRQLEEKDQAIAALTQELEQKNFDINELKDHVEKLNTHVTELTETNKQQEQTINAQDEKLNEGYYIIGTKNELKSAGVMKGGSLFSKSKLSMSDVNTSAFKKIDIRKTRTFSIPGKKPQLMTQAPAGSYTITQNSDGTSTLTVNDPASFWGLSKYLVIKY